jgi:hypothetical protein
MCTFIRTVRLGNLQSRGLVPRRAFNKLPIASQETNIECFHDTVQCALRTRGCGSLSSNNPLDISITTINMASSLVVKS